MKKKLLIAVGAVLALGLVMTMAAGSVPFLRGGLAAAQEVVGAEGTEVVEAVQDPYAVISEAAVVPVRHAALSLSASGIVAEVLMGEGELVEEGFCCVVLFHFIKEYLFNISFHSFANLASAPT